MPRPEDSKSSPENKGKSPAFQFYPKDFLCDGKVLAMPLHVRGAYITMLCLDWIDDGIATSDFNTLSGLSPDDNGIGQLSRCFVEHPIKPGYLTNPRLLKERNNQKERSKKAKDAADMRWHEPSNAKKKRTVCTPSPTTSTSTTPINKNKGALSSADFVFPESLDNEPCRKAIDDLIKHRKQKGIKTTATSIEKLIGHYDSRAKELIENINHSIASNWIGVFAPKTGPPSAKATNYDRNKDQILKSFEEAKAREIR